MTTQARTIEAAPFGGPRRVSASRLFVPIFWGAIAINGCVMTWLWLRDGGMTQIHSASDLWTSAGRITGLAGAYLALVQVLLLARLPPLERQIGFDRLTVWHRRNGKLTIYLVVAHVVLITIGYAGGAHLSIFSQFSSFLSSYPGMITATIGTVMLIAVVFSSIVIVRRRLPYEAWYGLHITVYAAIYLAYLHQIPSGNEFVLKTAQSDWWLALYVATLVLVLAYRFVRPALRARRHHLRVAEVVREGPDTVSVRVEGDLLERLGAQAGQFMLWRFLTPGRWWQSHPFSLSAAPDGRSLRITVKGVGSYTRELAELKPGTRVLAERPVWPVRGRPSPPRAGHADRGGHRPDTAAGDARGASRPAGTDHADPPHRRR